MRLDLHPDSQSGAVAAIDALAERTAPGLLRLRYRVRGRIDAIRFPLAKPPERTDGLWRTTCFEAFIRRRGGGYSELNLSPSGQWAAYDFAAYRRGMVERALSPPEIATRVSASVFELEAVLRWAAGDHCRIGLSAVIEEKDGAKSFWALAHPPGSPDFHHPSCFALELPPPA